VSKKLILVSVVGFVILTVVVAVLSARKGDQRRPKPASQTLNLDTSASRFPDR